MNNSANDIFELKLIRLYCMCMFHFKWNRKSTTITFYKQANSQYLRNLFWSYIIIDIKFHETDCKKCVNECFIFDVTCAKCLLKITGFVSVLKTFTC